MKVKEERNVSLDLLKILGMFFIVCIHFIGYSKLIDITDRQSANYIAMLVLNAIFMVAVPCYFLISGYFLCKSSFDSKKIVKIWGTTIFYSLLLLSLYILKKVSLSPQSWLRFLFPVLSGSYWFVTAYVLLYFLFPFLNIVINKMNKKQFQVLLCILGIANCVCATFFPINTVFDATSGLSIVYAIFLYCIAAYIRIYKKTNLETKRNLLKYLILFLLGIVAQVLLFYFLNPIRHTNSLVNLFASRAFSYNSIFCVLASVSLFLFFVNIKIKNKILVEIVLYFRPLLFAVYLIHANPIFQDGLWEVVNGRQYANSPLWLLIGKILGISFLIFISCMGVELLRKWIFKILSKLKIFKNISEYCNKQYAKLNDILRWDKEENV